MRNYKKIAEELFKLLDNIDTASDMAKDNDKLYRALVAKEHKKRFNYASTDGFKIQWK
jgi:hypothetical protein